MKSLLISVIFMAVSFSPVHSQLINIGEDIHVKPPKHILLDKCFIECIYEHYTYDSIRDESEITDNILEIGRKASRYSSYGTYRRDSLVMADYPDGLGFYKYQEITRKYQGASLTQIVRDISNNTLTNYESIAMDKYCYEEPIPQMDWHLSNEKAKICGHICQKATTTFRGRDWTAWYCEDIHVDNGPWKFNGLPGLILKVSDSRDEHIFEAISIRQCNRFFGRHDRPSLIKIDRKKFNQIMSEYKSDVGSFLAGNPNIPTNLDGTPAIGHKRMFYNPIEKD